MLILQKIIKIIINFKSFLYKKTILFKQIRNKHRKLIKIIEILNLHIKQKEVYMKNYFLNNKMIKGLKVLIYNIKAKKFHSIIIINWIKANNYLMKIIIN